MSVVGDHGMQALAYAMRVALDMSAVGGGDAPRAGDEVTVIGRRDTVRGFVASGFIQEMPAAGSALPRQPR